MNRQVLLAVITFLFLTTTSLAQGTFNFHLRVVDTKGQAKSNLPITLVETETFEQKQFRTNAGGICQIQLNEGKKWTMHVGDMKNYEVLTMSSGGGSGNASVTYDVERWNRINQPPVDRSKLNLTEVKQTVSGRDMPPAGKSIIEIKAVNKTGRPWQNTEVKLTCYELGQSFTAQTDGKGTARFSVPNNQSYQIDLDGEDNFEYIDVGNRSTIKGLTLTYEKINFQEQLNPKGYLEQSFTDEPKPISNRVMVTLFIQGGSKGGRGEDVFLDMTYSNKRYHGVTDEEGKVVFLLPKKRSYLVSFPYQQHAEMIDLTRFFGIGYVQQGVAYSPDPRLEFPERYLPTASSIKTFNINSGVKKRYPDNPEDGLVNVHLKWGNKKINSGSKEALLELGFSVKDRKLKTSSAPPLNLAFVLDRSGSMGGEPMDMLKTAMLDFVKKLRPKDKVSLVFFNGSATVAYPMGPAKKNELESLIAALNAGGGTNIYEGLAAGYKEVDRVFDPKAVNRVFLLTDGYGSKPVDFVIEQSRKYFEKGISVSTLGIGAGSNTALLSLLSKYSGGFEHQVMDGEGISRAMEQEFESLYYPLASDLKITVRYNNRVIYKTLYGIPEAKKGNNSVSFELGKVFSSLNRMALMKFKIENPDRDIDKNKVSVEVAYFDEATQEKVKYTKETHLEWTDETDIELIHDARMKNLYSQAMVNQMMKAIADLCDQKQYEEAKKNIHQTVKAIKKETNEEYSPEMLQIIEQLKGYLVALDNALKKNG